VIDRRTFLASTGAVLLAAPLAANAQEAGKVWRIGLLSADSIELDKPYRAAFQEGLRELQYVEGRNVVIEQRHADGRREQFPALAAELVRSKIDVLVVHGFPEAVRAAEQASSAIPIIFVANPDPIVSGIVASLARPGGRVTGLSDMHSDLAAKRLELLKGAVPSLSRVAVLHTASPIARRALKDTQTAASALGLTVVPVEIGSSAGLADIDGVFATIRRERAEALNVLFAAAGIHQKRVADLAVKRGVLTVGTSRRSAESGYLMSYGANFPELYRRAATYVDKIFRGTKPADLPVEQPTKFELVINLKTAKALGLTIPPAMLGRADEVIQ
jgi:putative ABC transport system substrate-binding protein